MRLVFTIGLVFRKRDFFAAASAVGVRGEGSFEIDRMQLDTSYVDSLLFVAGSKHETSQRR